MNLSNNNHLPPKVEKSGNVKIITFTGDEVRDVENVLAKELKGHMEDLGECHLLLDFTNVEYLSSVELGTLITLHKRMKASGGRLTLFNLNAQVYEVFTVTRLQTLLGICREEVPPKVNQPNSTPGMRPKLSVHKRKKNSQGAQV
jgi:anti-sigma B factor antagonist